jgi:hypothetical protein
MSADPARPQLGELLVHKGVLTDDQLQLALAEQQRTGAPLGEILVRLGFAMGPTIANALAEQHGGPLRTEYGLSIGPTRPVGTPADPTRNLKPVPDPPDTREQDTAIVYLTASLEEKSDELARVRADLESAAGQVAAAVSELAGARREQDALRVELAAAAQDVSALKQALAAATEKHAEEIAKARESITSLQAAAAPAENGDELALARRNIRSLEQELAAATRAHRDELAQARLELAALGQALAEAADATEPEREPETEHLLFVPGPDGYVLIERNGAAPAAGSAVEVDGVAYTVLKVGPSPLSGGRRCAFLA